jgi:diazepam-binding inhibitor (GABA receptor modulating acyl-CoA-binding protein)
LPYLKVRMTSDKLNIKFSKAVAFVNDFTEPLPADLLLKLYAYYRIANENFNHPGSSTPLINAFKSNALIQAQNVKPKQAMKLYIALVDKELRNKV